MNKKNTSDKVSRKASNETKSIGGQPENDKDARDAGLSSATPGNDEKKKEPKKSATPAKTKK